MRDEQKPEFYADRQHDRLPCLYCAGLGALAFAGCAALLYWAREILNTGWGS